MGQTPPPWHGQAVATQILFDHDWPGFEVHRLRMEYSEEMVEVGRFQWRKIFHLFELIWKARQVLKTHPDCVLFYPPASAKWVPFLRDVIFLSATRYLAGSTVFIYHASGLPVFSKSGIIRRLLSRIVYHNAEVSLEVAQEKVTPHETFESQSWQWCPCAIEVPNRPRPVRQSNAPFTATFVGSLQEGKGVLEVMKTAKILKNQGHGDRFLFRVIGKWFSEEFESQARQMHRDMELEGLVELVGQLTGDAKWDAYYESDVFFFPTHYASEATPIVVMEALGAGLHILSTEWAGIPSMLEGCPSATLLPIKSPDLYASSLIRLAEDHSRAERDFDHSREFYQKNFVPSRFIKRVNQAFLKVSSLASNVSPPNHQSPITNNSSVSAHLGDLSALAANSSSSPISNLQSPISVSVYLADQNPGYDRSYGISRMTQVVINALNRSGRVDIATVSSQTSQQASTEVANRTLLPWGTRRKWMRMITDHLHPMFVRPRDEADVHYFPKGYLPYFSIWASPSVVTIHDTIIQYDEDHYPQWRSKWAYCYWAKMLRHTLRHADRIMTVSQNAKRQIVDYMQRHGLPVREIIVTYEPCMYESLPQPAGIEKENYVIHLASLEPHKRTAHLIRWWVDAENRGERLPTLHLIGSVPSEVMSILAGAKSIVKRPFLEESALQDAYLKASALILPSEIEGFGLPALEAYYLGTPVCFVRGTSVEEILCVATTKGGFNLHDPKSLFTALDEIMSMSTDEIKSCGLKLRDTYASQKIANRMIEVFEDVAESCKVARSGSDRRW
jgi:glycosyltransferase involved in cell wall biosynthesis